MRVTLPALFMPKFSELSPIERIYPDGQEACGYYNLLYKCPFSSLYQS